MQTSVSEFLCVGDHVSLFCEETEGYIFNWQTRPFQQIYDLSDIRDHDNWKASDVYAPRIVRTSSAHNNLFIYQWQDREKPTNVPNPQALQFQVCIQNRYKLNKKHRKLLPANPETETDVSLETKTIRAQAKLAAVAENEDNISEQRRQHGKRVRYGEVIQLKHVFTSKYIHISTTQTSRRDKNNMLVHLQEYNSKHAQVKILPRYKVKSEGEFVQIFDQIIFESVKSPGQFFHASAAWKIDHFTIGFATRLCLHAKGLFGLFSCSSELNLGIQPAGFTVVKNYRPAEPHGTLTKQKSVRIRVRKQMHICQMVICHKITFFNEQKGGSVIRLFHKELEAYVVAEGLFDEQICEDGETIRWEQQVRFRHMTTRQYLCISPDRRVTLTPDLKDPRTVFRLHPVIKEADEIHIESYARIEHVITGYWLHALRDEEYVRRQIREAQEESGDSMKSLRWDGAFLRKISASGEKMYHDAYTIQLVEPEHLKNFNFVAGMVPFLLNLILDALQELKDFMIIKGVATKERQKLMRNLRVIDLLVRLLQTQLQGAIDLTHLTRVFKGAYDVLYTYMIGNSRKNALYFAKYIEFFQTQITVTVGDIGLNVAQMIVELIRDNRKIVDRVTQDQIEMFVSLLRQNRVSTSIHNYRYLDLLNVLCVCDGVAIPDNQTYITEHWLRRDTSGMRFLTERGQNVNGQPNIIYVSMDNGTTWSPLHEFVDRENNLTYSDEDVKFFEHQLDLFGKISYGRNDFSIFVITRELGILTWDEAFLSMRSSLLPDSLRAKYCELIIGLFIDVGTNYSVLDHTNLSFVYEDVLSPGPNSDGEFIRQGVHLENQMGLELIGESLDVRAVIKKLPAMDNWISQDGIKRPLPALENWLSPEGIIKDLVTLFPVIRDWIAEFLEDNKDMTLDMKGRNMLIEQVLRLFHFLVKFGYYSSDDIKSLLKPLLNLLNGKLDKPFPPDSDKGGFTKDSVKLVNMYRLKQRYEPSAETKAIVNAKYQAMSVLDLLLTFQFNTRLESFIAKFKTAETSTVAKKTKLHSVLSPLLNDDFDAFDQTKKALNQQKKGLKELRAMFDATAYFDSDQITSILMVLITTDSCHVHREIARTMPILRRFSKAKLNDDQVKTMGAVLDRYTEFCHLPKEENERHPMNQSILINHEVLALVFDILSSEIDAKLMEQYRGLEEILKKSLKLLKALAMGNDVVQMRMFERLDELLRIKVVESDIAIALKEPSLLQTFIGNQLTCLKILPSQIQAIVDLAAEHQEKAPEFLDLLNVIVKVEGLGLTLKRNQAYVMKYIMQDYNKLAYVLDQPRELKERILTMQSGKDHLKYLINLIDLLATCAEGENRFIESMCQTIMSVEELMWVINHPEIDNNLKKPFLRYFLWVYMKTAGSAVESGAGDLPHDAQLWRFMKQAAKDACELTEFISRNQETASNLLKKPPAKTHTHPAGMSSIVHVMHLANRVRFQAFYTKFYIPDKDLYPQEVENTDKLSRALVGFCEAAIPLLMNPAHLKTVISCITAIIPSSTVPNSVMEGLIEQLRNSNRLRESRHQVTKGHKEYYQGELELNAKLRIFAVNCSLLYGGHNTVQAQLKTKSKRTYTEIGGDEELPLGEEFQEHLRRFIKPGEKKVKKRIELCLKLVNQLGISSLMYRKLTLTEAARIEQEELDIRCLQLLRATIHNEERKLPEDWEEHPSEHRKQMKMIKELQIELNEMGAVIKALPHLARPSDRIAKEVLAFVCIMLFNANNDVQSSLLYYFLHTREESFFAAIRERMHLSALAIKERRSLAAQQRARAKEVVAQSKSMHSTMAIGKKALQRKVSLSTLQSKAARRRDDQKKGKSTKQKPPKETKVNGYANERCKDSQTLINNEQFEMDTIDLANETSVEPASGTTGVMGEEEMEEIDQKDDGYIELVLRVLARMCDGQHRGLQDYLREQPDNMKSFNIVAETAQFVNLVYSNVNAQNIVLATQLFETLNEFTVGNQSNRSVMLNSKVIDYINFILRAAEFSDCDQHKVLELKQSIGNIVISMVEENSPESLQVAKEVKDTLDKEAIYRCLTACYETTQPDRAKYNANPLLAEEEPKGPLNIGVTLQSARNLAKLGTQMLKSKQQDVKVDPETKEMLDEVGFTFYLILARVYDLDPKLVKTEVNITSQQMEAFNHYRKNTMSIEILKEDHLQKINFRVKNKNVLREEVKEKLIWSVDRSSPSNKIRDLMKWSKDILKDIYYQRKILSNPLATFFTKNW
ncbi:hypothetical protein CAPTEDRAFT_201920 [Capitella teleta]|uniref:Inositol 1,4,5-trisphosphate receptor n=1 Tax=Capitella teleta TaxID=283909 RepID=R7TCA6_CAPTE|nr:hypothetical protein CAPTEDRAFT_201920 [Capitella teleta]|eukprot:ELT91343.1 hypothetical protein CAPTEDRAFT_201920 [Capitella teleta]